MPLLPGVTAPETGLVPLLLCFLVVPGPSLKSALPPITPSATKPHLARRPQGRGTRASITPLTRKASAGRASCEPASFCGTGSDAAGPGLRKTLRISTSATGSWAVLHESRENKPFALSLPACKTRIILPCRDNSPFFLLGPREAAVLKAVLLSAGVQVHTPLHVSPHPGQEGNAHGHRRSPGTGAPASPSGRGGCAGTMQLATHLATLALERIRMPLGRLVLQKNI